MNIYPRRCRTIALFLAALLGWVTPLAAQNLVIRGGTLIDGTGKAPQRGVTILIRSGKIEAVGPDVKVPSGVKVVEADGKFIIPGLIDARVEIGPSPGNRVDRGEVQIEQRLLSLQALLGAGVTTSRLIQGDFDEQKLYLRWWGEELLLSSRMILSGPVFTAPNGHPSDLYSVAATNARRRETREVANADEARDKSRELAHTGLNVFEAVYDKGPDTSPYVRLDTDALEALIQEAHGHELKFFCEVGRGEEAGTAVSLGADAIEGVWDEQLSDAVLAEMAKKRIYFVPVLTEQGDLANLIDEQTLHAYLAEPIVKRTVSDVLAKGLDEKGGAVGYTRNMVNTTPSLRELFKKQQDRAQDNVRRAMAAGVPIAVGTGAGNLLVFPGASIHRELELLVRAGLSPMDAIVAATRNTAESLGRDSIVGTVETGKVGDLVILSADPTADIKNTQKIESVVQNGRLYLASDLDVRRAPEPSVSSKTVVAANSH
jgi:imidazolonepropionase-like amidohydrolase